MSGSETPTEIGSLLSPLSPESLSSPHAATTSAVTAARTTATQNRDRPGFSLLICISYLPRARPSEGRARCSPSVSSQLLRNGLQSFAAIVCNLP